MSKNNVRQCIRISPPKVSLLTSEGNLSSWIKSKGEWSKWRPEDFINHTLKSSCQFVISHGCEPHYGSSCLEGSGARSVLTNSEGIESTYALRFKFEASNNEAEYEALIDGLRIAEQMGVQKEILAVVEEEGHSWMTPLLEYLTDGTLPAEVKRARSIKIKSRQYDVINGVIYRKPFLEPWLRCVGPLQAEYIVREIHEGSYNMHSGPRSVVARAVWVTRRDHLDTNAVQGTTLQDCVRSSTSNKDILEEMREKAAIQEARSKAKMEKYYNAKVRRTIFKPGDFVYRCNEASHAKEGGKLGPK
ncbi:reverse transcriptase domain-containing protein [Tanacetum coccineum]